MKTDGWMENCYSINCDCLAVQYTGHAFMTMTLLTRTCYDESEDSNGTAAAEIDEACEGNVSNVRRNILR